VFTLFSLGKGKKKTRYFLSVNVKKWEPGKGKKHVIFPREKKYPPKGGYRDFFPDGQRGKVVVRQLSHDDSFPCPLTKMFFSMKTGTLAR
jgi:hypothetical protein